MQDFTNIQIPKPKDDKHFERQTKVLFEHILDNPQTKGNGRSGQPQAGVDVYGERIVDGSIKHWVGVQCKLTESKKLSKNVVKDEATKALSFIPPLTEFIIVTTAGDDAALDREARTFTDDQKKLGRDFRVSVWGWDTIATYAARYTETREIFYPDATPYAKKTLEVAVQNNELVNQLFAEVRALKAQTRNGNLFEITKDTQSLNSIYDREIDSYKQLIDEQPQTALGLLQRLSESLPSDIDKRTIFRMKANISSCYLRLGMHTEAGQGYIEAYELSPELEKADAFKVLGLTLQERFQEAIDYGISQMEKTKNKVTLITSILEAKRNNPIEQKPFSFIPIELLDDKDVLINMINYYRSYPITRKEWRDLAFKAYSLYSINEVMQRYNAEAKLDEILEQRKPIFECKNTLSDIINTLEPIWTKRLNSEVKWDDYHLSVTSNLAFAYRLLSNYPKAKEVIEAASIAKPDDQQINQIRYILAVDMGDLTLADNLFQKIPIDRNSVCGRLQILVNEERWIDITSLPCISEISDFTQEDVSFYETAQVLASLHLESDLNAKELYSDLIERFPNCLMPHIGFYKISKDLNDKEWSQAIYQSALSTYTNPSFEQRNMLARLAEKENDPDSVIDLLEGIVDEDEDSEELRCLSVAYANARTRQSSLNFAENISPNLSKLSHYLHVKANIYYHAGKFDKAEKAYLNFITMAPNNVSAHIGLINTYSRLNKETEIKKHIQKIQPTKLVGSNEYKIGLAQMMSRHGRTNDALALGYKTALENQDDPRISLLYLGLFFSKHAPKIDFLSSTVSALDYSITLRSSDGKTRTITIENGPERPSIDHYSLNHDLSKVLINKSVGEKASLVKSLGTPIEFEIIEIQHKYIHLLNEIMANFPTKFPNHGGLYLYTSVPGDISAILDDIKRLADRDELLFDFYLQQHLPMALMKGFGGGNVIEFYHKLRRSGHFLKTCVGTAAERNRSNQLCKHHKDKGIVLDTYTAWFIAQNDLFPILKYIFPIIAISQSTLDDLQTMKQNLSLDTDEPRMTVGYIDGQFYRQDITKEMIERELSEIDKIIATISSQTVLMTPIVSKSPNKLEAEIIKIAGPTFFDPVYIAQANNIILLSEDMNYRNLANQEHNVEGVWLQSVMLYGVENQIITPEKYAATVINLANAGHFYLTLNSQTLIEILKQDKSENLDQFKRVAEFIGSKDADPTSHTVVALEFITQVWLQQLPLLKIHHSISILLSRMKVMGVQYGMVNAVFNALLNNTDVNPVAKSYLLDGMCFNLAHNYIKGWLIGHFMITDSKLQK